MITCSDRFEPDWVHTQAGRDHWRRDLIIALAGAVGLSSSFIAVGLGGISCRQVRNVLAGEAASDPLVVRVREIIAADAESGSE
jgi:hypothetical protein